MRKNRYWTMKREERWKEERKTVEVDRCTACYSVNSFFSTAVLFSFFLSFPFFCFSSFFYSLFSFVFPIIYLFWITSSDMRERERERCFFETEELRILSRWIYSLNGLSLYEPENVSKNLSIITNIEK